MRNIIFSIIILCVGFALGVFTPPLVTEKEKKGSLLVPAHMSSKSENRQYHSNELNISSDPISEADDQEVLMDSGILTELQTKINSYHAFTSTDFENELEEILSLPRSEQMFAAHLFFSVWGEKEPEKALELTAMEYPDSFESLLEEIKGDIFASQKKTDEARKAYERAILTNEGGSTEFIQMKLDDLG